MARKQPASSRTQTPSPIDAAPGQPAPPADALREAEEALRETREQLRLFVAYAPAAIAMVDREMRYIAASDRWFSDYDLRDRDIIGRSHYEVFPDVPERWKEIHRRCLAGAVERNDADPWVRAGGRIEWVRWEIHPWHTAENTIGGLMMFTEVITDRKRTESLVEEQVRHLSALRAIDAAIISGLDLHATLDLLLAHARAELSVDAAAVFLLPPGSESLVYTAGHGFRTPGITGRRPPLAEAGLPAGTPELMAAEGFVGSHALPLIVADRIKGALEVFYRTAPDRSPEWQSFLEALAGQAAIAIDRAQLSESLRTSREHEQQAVTAGRVGLWDWDLRSNRVYFSPEWKRQIGYAPDEISDDFSEWQTRVHPEDLDRCLTALHSYLANPVTPYAEEFRFRHRNGSYRHILAHGSLVRDETGRPVRMLGSHVDVTELTELQSQFLQAQKMESVGRLAGGIAHDFNNLLTAINGTADLAMLGLREDDPLFGDLREIRRAGDRAAILTRQLLAFSRKQVLQPAVLRLSTLVSEMEQMLRRLIGEDVILEITSEPGLGQVKADPGQLEQVVVNLVVNARDAMPQGGTLRLATRNIDLDETYTRMHPDVAPGAYVELAVSDTGTGMDAATLDRLFEPFFTTKGAGKGTGLGLSTVFGIVKQSGGSVQVASEPGCGSRFTIHLPRVPEGGTAARHSQPHPVVGGKETVLVVEDEDGLRKVAVRALTAAGYRVLVAANGADALQLLEREPGAVNLMLTDVIMPGMSGRELADRLRLIRPAMRVLFTSGYAPDVITHHGALDEDLHFLGKPYTIAELKAKVREVLDL